MIATPDHTYTIWLRHSWIVAVLFLLVACGQTTASTSPSAPTGAAVATQPADSTNAAAGQPIKVVTTMSILADMVKQVGGARVQANNIIPVGAGPEDYQPTPQAAQQISQAAIVFYNGHGLEAWLQDLLKSAAKPNQPQIAVSDGLQAVDVGSADFSEGNPHFWMSALNGVAYVEKIRAGLTQVDPDGKALYAANAAAYSAQLKQLDAELKQQAATLPAANRKLVTNHDAFPYFAQAYGFTIVGNILGNPEAELSAGDLAQLVEKVKSEHVKAVFSESQFNPKVAQALADEAGVQDVSDLYTDTLGTPDSGIASYIDMLRYDMKTIVNALK